MKELLTRHTDAISSHTNLNVQSIKEKVTYLFEFDREVQ